jgi:hypothetical protein
MLNARQTVVFLGGTLLFVPFLSLAQQQTAPARKSTAAPKSATAPKKAAIPAPVAPVAAPAAPAPVDDVLNNDSILGMLKAGQDPAAVIEKIKTSKARFELDGDHLMALKANNVPSAVIRAMLNKAPAADESVAPAVASNPEPPAASAPPAPPAPPPIPANLENAVVRQGETSLPLTERPQKVMFVKSDAADPKAAIADLLITQVGLPLLTMGMSSQMGMWNPYMNEAFTKAINIGKGMVLGRGSDTQGFEFDMLPGTSSALTIKSGPAEFLLPLNRYLASANVDLAEWQPVLLRLETRDKDQARVLSSRHVRLKQVKKGRFDMKPTMERQESEVQQTNIPVNIRRVEGNIYSIAPLEPLTAGEYAIVFRGKAPAGSYTTNVPLRVVSPPPAVENDPYAMPQGGKPGMPSGGLMGGLMGRRQSAPSPMMNSLNPQPPKQQMTGFIAWDFRVLP